MGENKAPTVASEAAQDDTPGALHGAGIPRRSVRTGLVVTVGVLVLLLVAAVVTVAALNRGRTAQATAEEYFAALAAGDASTANALTSPPDAEATDTSLLTDEVLAGATERISDVSVTPSDDPVDVLDQKVDVAYTLAGERHTVTCVLTKGDPEWGFLTTWRMSSAFASDVLITVEGQGQFTIAGATADSTYPAVRLFPAVYPVEAVESTYFDLEQDALVISGTHDAADNRTAVTFEPTPVLENQVTDQVVEKIDTCAETTGTSERIDGCPLGVVLPQAGVESGTWEIVEYPTVDLSLGGTVYTTTGGHARFTPDGGGGPIDMIRGIELSGAVEVTDGQVRLNP